MAFTKILATARRFPLILAWVVAAGGLPLSAQVPADPGWRVGRFAQPPVAAPEMAEPRAILGARTEVIVSPASGGEVTMVLDGATLSDLVLAYPFGQAFGSGITTAVGELSGDGTDDVVVAMGPGGGLVRVFDGAALTELGRGYPFGADYAGGVSVALGDLNGDGRSDIIVGQASGGGLVRVFSGIDYAPLLSRTPFGATYQGGVNVAAGDVDGDGRVELVVAQARDGAVSVISGATQTTIVTASPYGSLAGGVFVASGDVNGDGHADIVVAPGSGAGAVLAYDLHALAVITSFAPYGPSFAGGVRLAVSDLDSDGHADIITIPGQGHEAELRVYDGATFALMSSRVVYASGYLNGAFVSAPPARSLVRFTSAATATFTVGTASSFAVSTNLAAAISVTGTLPAGVTFAAGGGANFAGIPAAGSGGSYPLTLSATIGSAPAVTQAFVLTVAEAPALTSVASTVCRVDSPCSYTITASGFPLPALTATGSLPNGVTFSDNGDGTATLSGTAARGTAGTYPLSISAGNSAGTNGQTFVLSVDQGLAFSSSDTASFTVGTAGTFAVSTVGFPPATVVDVSAGLPPGLVFADSGDGTGTLSGTPAASTGGQYPLTFTASNGVDTITQSFTLTVRQSPSIISANAVTFSQGSASSFTMGSTGYPPPTLSVSGTLPAGVTFVDDGDGSGRLSGVPAPGTAGSYPLTLSASNGVGQLTMQSFTLDVSAPPSITSAASAAFVVGTPGSFLVTTYGGPSSAVVTIAGTLPAGVLVVPNGNGTATLSGTAAAGSGGIYSLTISAVNGVGSPAQQAFTLTVNEAPSITSVSSAVFSEGVAGGFSITATGFATPAITIAGALPSGSTFMDNSDGTATLAGTPGAGSTGVYNLTVTASNGIGAPASQSFNLTVTATHPEAHGDSYYGAIGNTQLSVGAGIPATPAVVIAGSVLANDTGQAPLTAGPASIATTNGGLVALALDGSFLYSPPPGFTGANDSFTYVVTDGNGATDSGVATINVTAAVWYVSASASAGDGRSHSPYNTMTAAAAAAQANQVIYVHAGSPTGPTTLKSNQTLWGAGATFTLDGLTIAPTSAPTLLGTVTLANGVLVSSISVNGGAGAAITAIGLTGTETLDAVSISGGSAGLQLTSMGGAFSMVGGTIGGLSAGPGVQLNGGTGNVTIGASITTAAGRSVDITGRTAGTVTFTGPIVNTGAGIALANNAGSSVGFTGGLSLVTGVNDGFAATGGGSVIATQDNVSVVNTIATSSGTALLVSNAEIGAAGLTFRQISAGTSSYSTGAGIVLENTGLGAQHGGLTVVGTGVAQSGGVVRRKAGPDGSTTQGVGLFMSGTKNPSLRWMEFSGFQNAALVGRNVAGFSIADSSILDAGTSVGLREGPVVFGVPGPAGVNGATGNVVFRNTSITGGVEDNVMFFNQSGALDLVFDRTTPTPGDCTIGSNSATTGGRGLMVQMEGTATAAVTIAQCRFRNNRTTALQVTASDDADVSLLVTGSPTDTSQTSEFIHSQQGDTGILLTNAGNADLTATIENSYLVGFPAAAIRFGQATGNASDQSALHVRLVHNYIETPSYATEASVVARLSSTVGVTSVSRLLIADNIGTGGIIQSGLPPTVVVSAQDAGTLPLVDVTYENNHTDMNESAVGSGVRGPVGVVIQASAGSLCANVKSNISHWYPLVEPQGGGIRIEQAGSATMALERGQGQLTDPASSILSAANPPPSTTTMVTEALGNIAIVENGTCLLPLEQ